MEARVAIERRREITGIEVVVVVVGIEDDRRMWWGRPTEWMMETVGHEGWSWRRRPFKVSN